MDPAWVTAVTAFATLVGIVFVWAIRQAFKFTARLTRFVDDYYGEPATKTSSGTPGVMQRLQKLEVTMNSVSTQVHLNSGQSLKDAVVRTESEISQVRSDIKKLSDKVTKMGGS